MKTYFFENTEITRDELESIIGSYDLEYCEERADEEYEENGSNYHEILLPNDRLVIITDEEEE